MANTCPHYPELVLALFQTAKTREGSGVILYKENPPGTFTGPEDDSPCFWWRRGRVELGLKHGLAVIVAINWTVTGNLAAVGRRIAI